MTTADQVLGATGLLAEFNTAGVLAPADVHTARLIGDLWAEPDESVRLAIALAVRALRSGSVCLDITRLAEQAIATLEEVPDALSWPDPADWVAAIQRSPAVATATSGGSTGQPLRLVDTLLYLERWWRTEEVVRHQLQQRSVETVPLAPLPRLRRELDALFDDEALPAAEPPHQRLAAAMTALNQVTVVAGGPGTGKTTVVAKILALHEALHDAPPVVALAAPTGKAAARLEEAVRRSVDDLPTPWSSTAVPDAVTLHRLLGVRPGQAHARHNPDNPLPHELVVVDEMSMVSLSQMALLLQALRPHARLVLVGDPDQLTPVDAGAVLADITRAVPPTPDRMLASLAEVADSERPPALPTGAGVATLSFTWRFQGGIGRLARAIRAGDADMAVEVLQSGAEDVRLSPSDSNLNPATAAAIRDQVVGAGRAMHAAADAGDARKALSALEQHRVLCPPIGSVRGHPVGTPGPGLAPRGHQRLWLERRAVSRPADHDHRERSGCRALQRRRRGDRPHSCGPARCVRQRWRAKAPHPAGAECVRAGPRDDRAQVPGQSVPPDHPRPASGRITVADPGAGLYSRDAGQRARGGDRFTRGIRQSSGPPGRARLRAGSAAVSLGSALFAARADRQE